MLYEVITPDHGQHRQAANLPSGANLGVPQQIPTGARMSRFERKILFAIGLSVFLTLGGSIFLAQRALREVYRVGVNERFGAELIRGRNNFV